MKKRALISMVAGMAVIFALGGCGAKESNTVTEEKTEASTNETVTEQEETQSTADITISVGFENSMSDSMAKSVKKWAEILSERSGGTMELVLYPDSQLGSKNDLIDSMQLGESIITVADGAFLAEYGASDLGILYGPYLFNDWNQVWKLTESDWFKEQDDLLNTNGLKIVSANWKLGERNLFTVDLIEHPEDLKGKKIRVPNNQIQIAETNAIGATATPMSAGDVYQALQTKTIDGLENVNSALLSMQWCEVAKYVYEEEHVYNMAIWVCGTAMFDSLSEEQQNWLLESAGEAGLYNNELQDTDAEQVRETLVNEYGVTFTACSDEDKEKLVKMCESFYADSASFGWSDGLYERIQTIIK